MAAVVVISLVVLVLVWFVWPQRPSKTAPSGKDRPGVDEAELHEAEREVQEAPDEEKVRDWGPGTGKKPLP